MILPLLVFPASTFSAEVDHLYQEATMPLEEVVAKYGRAEEANEADEDLVRISLNLFSSSTTLRRNKLDRVSFKFIFAS
jgi:hypothetical protein